jgi:hypothetical protein
LAVKDHKDKAHEHFKESMSAALKVGSSEWVCCCGECWLLAAFFLLWHEEHQRKNQKRNQRKSQKKKKA